MAVRILHPFVLYPFLTTFFSEFHPAYLTHDLSGTSSPILPKFCPHLPASLSFSQWSQGQEWVRVRDLEFGGWVTEEV